MKIRPYVLVIVASVVLWVIILGALLAHGEDLEINMGVIAKIESSNNPKAFNASSGAVGLCQLRKCVLVEWNRYHLNNTYSMKDLYNAEVNKEIAKWYINVRIPAMLNYYKLDSDSIDARLACFNWGIGNYRQHILNGKTIPKETRDYLKRYHEAVKGLK